MSKIKNGGLDQHGAGPCEQQQSGTAGVAMKALMVEFYRMSTGPAPPPRIELCYV